MNTVHQLAYKQGRSHITLSSFVEKRVCNPILSIPWLLYGRK